MEAAEEDAGNAKFTFDRCKLSVENKVIIDNYLSHGALRSSVSSLQVTGLTVHFLNTSLEETGLYVTKEVHAHDFSSSLANLVSCVELALHLLCFRAGCVTICNAWNKQLIKQKKRQKTKKKDE